MKARSYRDAIENGTFYQFNVKGWTTPLAFPAADSISEAHGWVVEIEKECSNPLIVTGVERIIGGGIGCLYVENVDWPMPQSFAFCTH